MECCIMVTKVYGDTGVDKIVDGTITSSDLASGVGGKVLQVVSTAKTDVFTSGSTANWVAITGLSATITPSSTSSKILIMTNVSFGTDGAGNYDYGFAIYKNASVLTGATGDASSSSLRVSFSGASRQQYELNNGSMTYLDSPSSTSSLTYSIYGRANGGTLYVNRCVFDDGTAGSERGISTITVMEVAG